MQHELIELKDFCAMHDLPANFGVAFFEPKDYSGLGRIDHAGAAMNAFRNRILDAIPQGLTPIEWVNEIDRLQGLFFEELTGINPAIGLREVEIDFAAAGFGDMLRTLVYAHIRGTTTFDASYDEWLDSTYRTATTAYPYEHKGATWQVRILSHAYGRIGLVVQIEDAEFYVHDNTIACPAEGFMQALLRDVATRILTG